MADSYRILPLTRGQFALLDPEDYARAAKHKWCALTVNGKTYAQRWVAPGRAEYLHRLISGVQPGRVARPINGDALDCRKENLRIAKTRQEWDEEDRLIGPTPKAKGRDIVKLKKWQKETWQRRREEWFAANGPCQWCGSQERLEADHVEPGLKVANCVWHWTEERRMAELAKCRVLCHDCHVKRHHPEPEHGTSTRYRYRNCRCDDCVKAERFRKRDGAKRKGGGPAPNRTEDRSIMSRLL